MGAHQEEPSRGEVAIGDVICSVLSVASIVALIVTAVSSVTLVMKDYSRMSSSKEPECSLAITGAAGLDDLAVRDRPTLSPVFNLTVHVNNTGNKIQRECIDEFSTVAVSYGDAFLAKGSVPAFCAEMGQENEAAATAWGQDVLVPLFLRERLAGELRRGEGEVDVQVTTPRQDDDAVLVCKAKIGGGPSPCRRDHVYPRPAPATGPTG